MPKLRPQIAHTLTTYEAAQDCKLELVDASRNLLDDIKRGDILTAAWAIRRVENLLNDPNTLAAYGFKLDSSDIMRPRLVKITDKTTAL